MHVTIVHIHVKPECLDAFLTQTQNNHENSVREPGNLRFDILRSEADPCYFVFYEAYKDVAAAAAHRETTHYVAWREAVAEMMAAPREGVKFSGLWPKF